MTAPLDFATHVADASARHELFGARAAAARTFVKSLDALGVAGGFCGEGSWLKWEWYRSANRCEVRVWLRVRFGYGPEDGVRMQWERQVSAPFRGGVDESGTFAACDPLLPRLVTLLRTVALSEGNIDAALRAP